MRRRWRSELKAINQCRGCGESSPSEYDGYVAVCPDALLRCGFAAFQGAAAASELVVNIAAIHRSKSSTHESSPSEMEME